jgi:hypothetical protein
MEQRTAGRQRSLTELSLLSPTQACPVSVTPYDVDDDDVVRGLDPRTHRSLQEQFSKEQKKMGCRVKCLAGDMRSNDGCGT